MVQKFLLSLLTLSLGICANAARLEDPPKLTILMSQNSAYVIDTPAQSCVDEASNVAGAAPVQNLPAPHFIYPGLQINWADPSSTAYISSMEISFPPDTQLGADFKCVLTGPELGFILAGNENWDGRIAPATFGANHSVIPTSVGTACSLRCGGVPVNKTSSSFSITGHLIVRGLSMGSDNVQKPILETSPVILISE